MENPESNPLLIKYRKQSNFKGMSFTTDDHDYSGSEEDMSYDCGSEEVLLARLKMLHDLFYEKLGIAENDSAEIFIYGESKKALPYIDWQTEGGETFKVPEIMQKLSNAALNENYPYGAFYEYNDNDYSLTSCHTTLDIPAPSKADKEKAGVDMVQFISQLPVKPKVKKELLDKVIALVDLPVVREALIEKVSEQSMDIEVELN